MFVIPSFSLRPAFGLILMLVLCAAAHASPGSAAAAASSASRVTGRVSDATTSAPVVQARVTAGPHSARVDADGRFALPLAPGTWSLEARAEGYRSARVDVEVREGATTDLDILLVPEAAFREQVDVVASADARSEPPATVSVPPSQVVAVAGGAENVFRVLQTLPGVTGTDEFSSRLSVRGGGPDQNLTVMDGVEIHNPYRLFGLASAFNPETVDRFELTAGAFSARYGDRLSSLLVVDNRAGSTERALTGSAALSLTDANLILEGKLPKGRGSWLVTGRRTYYDLVAERFTDSDLPSFSDLQGKLVFELGGGRRLSLFGLTSREKTDASFDSQAEAAKGAIYTRTRNDLLAATFYTPLGASGWARSVGSLYTNTDSFDFNGNFRDDERRSNAPDVSGFGTAQVAVTWDGIVRDRALRQELGWQLGSRHILETGFEVHDLRTQVKFAIAGSRNNTQANGSSLQGGASLPDLLDSSRSDTRMGAWLQDRWEASSQLVLEPGLRLDRSTINERTAISPRLAATWSPRPDTRLRAAFGLHTQSPGYEKLMQADYFMDLSSPGPLPIESERARHALLSLERDLPSGVLARVDAYYKGFDRLIVGRLETPAETQARLARYDFPADLAWSLPADPGVTTIPTNDGRGRGWGFDLYLARRATSPETRLTGWASYTFGRADRESFGRSYPFDYDRRHAVSVVASLRATSRLELSATLRVASGFPYTPVLGLRVAATPAKAGGGDPGRLVPEVDNEGRLVYTTDRGGVDNLNSARLPYYARLDARATYTPGWGRGHVRLYLDVMNVLNRENAGVVQSKLEYDPTSDRPRLTRTRQGSIPFLPSFGIHIDFGTPKGARAVQPN